MLLVMWGIKNKEGGPNHLAQLSTNNLCTAST